MSKDALDHLCSRRMGKAQRAEFGAVKRQQEEAAFLGDASKVNEAHRKYNAEINRQRIAAGLKPLKG
jgi:hypothetical protein